MIALRECPCCGFSDVYVSDGCVYCQECTLQTGVYESDDEAMQAWNTRESDKLHILMNKYKVKVVFIESGKCGYVIVEAIDNHLALQVAQLEYECVAIMATMLW